MTRPRHADLLLTRYVDATGQERDASWPVPGTLTAMQTDLFKPLLSAMTLFAPKVEETLNSLSGRWDSASKAPESISTQSRD